MPPKEVTPQLGLESFSCPHCGALAAQHWMKVLPKSFERKQAPHITTADAVKGIKLDGMEKANKTRFTDLILRFEKNEVTFRTHEYAQDSSWEMVNMFMSLCHACDGFTVWIKDSVAWPTPTTDIAPHDDMPPDVKTDFVEAASIIDMSPRGAAALSRLALQKLMVDLGEKGHNINDDIASLVKKGLETEIQQALDIVRVVGNNAVHPGTIDLKDDKATAVTLLQLVTLVVDRRIATQKRIDEMFKSLPPGALAAIQKRDGG